MPYGPCQLCGDTNYALSMGGPGICPSCDCGNFGPHTVKRQAKTIYELRERVTKLEAEVQSAEINGAAAMGGLITFAQAYREHQVIQRLERLIESLPPVPEDREIDSRRLAAMLGDDHFDGEEPVPANVPEELEGCIETPQGVAARLVLIEQQLGKKLGLVGDIRCQLIHLDLRNELVEDQLVADWHEYYSAYVHDQRSASYTASQKP